PSHWWLEKGEEIAHEGYEILFPHKSKLPKKGMQRWQVLLGGSFVFVLGVILWMWIAVARGLPTLDQLENPHPEVATQLISAYGVAAASQVFFGKDVTQLSTDEAAYLIGVLKGPENYDPDDNYDRAIARRNTVLDNMVEIKYLSRDQSASFKTMPIRVQAMKG